MTGIQKQIDRMAGTCTTETVPTEPLISYEEKLARKVVENWLWDCGEGNQALGFVQSELLQQRIVEAIRVARRS